MVRYSEIKAATLQPSTVRQSRNTLLRFVRFLEEGFPDIRVWSDIRRHPHIEDWLCSLHADQAITRVKYIQIVEQFLREMRHWQWPDPPVECLFVPTDLPRLPQRYPKPFDIESDRRLRAALEAETGVRNLGLQVLRETGLRVGELLSLPVDAARPNRNGQWDLKVPLGKTQTERLFPLMPKALACIQAISERRGLQVPGMNLPDRLMVDELGNTVAYHALHHHLKGIARKAGLTHWERVHLHQFRHTFATELARAEIPLPSLMRLLGHSRPGITLQYVELNGTDVRQVYQQALSRLSALPSLVSRMPDANDATLPPTDRLALFLTSLERERRDLPAHDPQAAQLLRLVRKLQAILRSMKTQSA